MIQYSTIISQEELDALETLVELGAEQVKNSDFRDPGEEHEWQQRIMHARNFLEQAGEEEI